jgi:hypothetical protein
MNDHPEDTPTNPTNPSAGQTELPNEQAFANMTWDDDGGARSREDYEYEQRRNAGQEQ